MWKYHRRPLRDITLRWRGDDGEAGRLAAGEAKEDRETRVLVRKNPASFDLLFLSRYFSLLSLALTFSLSVPPAPLFLSLYLKHIIKKSQTCGRPEFIARFLSFYERETRVNNLPSNTSHAAAYIPPFERS